MERKRSNNEIDDKLCVRIKICS